MLIHLSKEQKSANNTTVTVLFCMHRVCCNRRQHAVWRSTSVRKH